MNSRRRTLRKPQIFQYAKGGQCCRRCLAQARLHGAKPWKRRPRPHPGLGIHLSAQQSRQLQTQQVPQCKAQLRTCSVGSTSRSRPRRRARTRARSLAVAFGDTHQQERDGPVRRAKRSHRQARPGAVHPRKILPGITYHEQIRAAQPNRSMSRNELPGSVAKIATAWARHRPQSGSRLRVAGADLDAA